VCVSLTDLVGTLLPVRAFSCAEFDVAGHLMPAYHVGGDCFDYSVETDALHLSVTDAMGHGVSASLLDGLTAGALRNSRRGGASVAEQAQTAHAVVHQQFGGAQFDTGQSTKFNAGFPPVHRLRAGRAERAVLSAQLPLGLFPDTAYRAERRELHPGARLLFTSDRAVTLDIAFCSRVVYALVRLYYLILWVWSALMGRPAAGD